MTVRIQMRRDTAANWIKYNPILASGEIGLETDTSKIKVGNGNDVYTDLPYKIVTTEQINLISQQQLTGESITGGAIKYGIWYAVSSGNVARNRTVTDFIELPTTHNHELLFKIPLLDLSSPEYPFISLYKAPSNDTASLVGYFKRDGGTLGGSELTISDVKCVADTTINSSPYYLYEPSTKTLSYNPSEVKYIRCSLQDAQLTYEYTITTQNVVESVDITHGVIKSTHIEPTYHYSNVVRGNMYNNKTYILPETTGNVAAAAMMTLTSLEDGSTFSCPTRVLTEPIELKYDGLVIDGTIYDYPGGGYDTLLFYDENNTPIEGYEGINGALNIITTNQIDIDSSVSKLTIVTSNSTTAHIKVPPTYKYVRSSTTFTPNAGIENGGIIVKYHYIGEPEKNIITSTTLDEYIDGKIKLPTQTSGTYHWSENYGKSVVALGGSFATTGYAQRAYDIWNEKLGLSYKSVAVGGAGFCVGSTFVTQATNAPVADIYVIWCSTNDFANGKPIGTKDDDYATTPTQWSAFKKVIETLYTKNPNAKICLFTSSPHLTNAKGNEEGIGSASSLTPLKEYVDAQIAVCKHYSIPVLDQYYQSNHNSFTKSLVCKSGDFHLTPYGYEVMAGRQLQMLASL